MTTMDPFGLTPVELSLFNEILRLKEAPLGKVIKSLGLHKGTAYNSIRRLEEKGLVSYQNKEGVNYYSVMPLSLQAVLIAETERYREKISQIKRFIALAHENTKHTDHNVQVFVGEKSFKSFFDDLYQYCYTTKKEYLFLGSGDEILRSFGIDYFIITQAKKKRLMIKSRSILDANFLNSPIRKKTFSNIRYFHSDSLSPVSTWIYGNKVVFVLWEAKPILTILIESASASTSFKSFFENLWCVASSPKLLIESRHKVNTFDFISQAKSSLDLYDLCGIDLVHEGRSKIIHLLKKGGRVRVLLSNPFCDNFKKKVFLEEKHITDLSHSRILFELKATLSNLEDIHHRTNKNIDVRFFDSMPDSTIIILDHEKILYTEFKEISDEYGSSQPTLLIDKKIYPTKAEKFNQKFERIWAESKPLSITHII